MTNSTSSKRSNNYRNKFLAAGIIVLVINPARAPKKPLF